ncbi:hypothetical protein [Ruminococcus sp. HUN007]|uniref:hypothetical protein n=1 Tax=Ruminococcus sp. HUN007 TaxID=1514668 RepID=UPI0005D283B5|nr:hypothetical protein [Ruminococcus sp. HUN007]
MSIKEHLPKELQNDNMFFQYRPIARKDRTEDGVEFYKDINRLVESEFFFAQPNQLNDPMDGKIHYYWHAESSIWKGVIYHYALTLYTRLLILSSGVTDLDSLSGFHVGGYWDNNSEKRHVKILIDEFFNTDYAKETLIKTDIRLRRMSGSGICGASPQTSTLIYE